MGNSFIGFPVPRARIADMISGSAPPKIHHTDHETGGGDEVDCTGLPGAGGISLPFDDVNLNETMQAKNCVYQTLGTSGVIGEGGDGVRVGSGTDENSYAEIKKVLYPFHAALTWPKKRTVVLNVDFSFSDGGNDEFWLVTGRYGNYKHIGFKVINQVLFGTCYEAAETEIALTGGANPNFSYTAYSLKFVYDGANNVKFFVNGVLRGEITTNIPTASTYALQIFDLYAKSFAAGWHCDIIFNNYMFYQAA